MSVQIKDCPYDVGEISLFPRKFPAKRCSSQSAHGLGIARVNPAFQKSPQKKIFQKRKMCY